MEESGAHDWRTDITAPNADDPEECLPFPTLEKILNVIDPKIGMMLEIKHPQLIDVWLSLSYIDRTTFVKPARLPIMDDRFWRVGQLKSL